MWWCDDKKLTLRIKVTEAEEGGTVATTEKDKPVREPSVESFGLTLARLTSDLREPPVGRSLRHLIRPVE